MTAPPESNTFFGYHVVLDGATRSDWLVRRFDLEERLSETYEGRVTFLANESVDALALRGKPAEVQLLLDESRQRMFHGAIIEVEQSFGGEADHGVEITVTFVPRLALLKLGRNSRIFQEKSIEDVVKEVLAEAGIADATEWATNGTYEPHANIVQYHESDYDFIARLLAEEGIGFVIRNDFDAEKAVFFDDTSAVEPLEGWEEILFGGAGAELLEHTTEAFEVASDRTMFRDYDLTRAGVDLSVNAEAPDSTLREVYRHPGGIPDQAALQRRADRALEALRTHVHTIEVHTHTPLLEPLRRFTIDGHPREDMMGDWQLVRVTHELDSRDGEGIRYRNHALAIPADVPYRRVEAPRAPFIGVEPAFVTVPSGEEIHSDSFGRVKARFPWDRSGITDDRSSTWIRVGQVALGGSMILPRGEFEVMVDHEAGDLDQPVISGHLYNADLPPPYALPGGCTRSSMQSNTTGGGGGANEVRFEDAAGGEEIFFNASKDISTTCANDSAIQVALDEYYEVTGDRSLAITGTASFAVTVNRKLTVGADQKNTIGGDISIGVGGALKETITGARMLKTGGDHPENIKVDYKRKVGSLSCLTGIAGYERKVVKSAKNTVSMAWVEIAGGSRQVTVTGSFTETVTALKWVKSKGYTITCGALYTVNAAAEKITIGGNRTDTATGAIGLTAIGAIKVKAKTVTISASSKLVARGGACTITLSKSGEVEIKAPNITVKNAKSLNQIMHKSN